MIDRWMLNRAGIVNVFQYDDEVLRFAGGRLLLRGVNGSGKSTAMNMLLPFLLEADVRRIDAAGEQTGVLRSWMLSGREEQQPVGYLWIEFRRGPRDRDDGGNGTSGADGDGTSGADGDGDGDGGGDGGDEQYLVCGCGIKANRSTERVTTWWFVTDQRPGIDVALVANRHPLSTEALRAELGTGAVFTQEQRGAYRDAVRQRLYGGAELDRHLRLLHEVRSPRVGDRISNDLPAYLLDALPQLSDRALDDAAQPLENLEEFRRNVENLTRTAATLDALTDVYRSYARGELRRRAESLCADAGAASRAAAAAGAARSEADRATEVAHAAKQHHQRLATEREQAASALSALLSSDDYKKGRRLDDLRQRVSELGSAVAGAIDALHSSGVSERHAVAALRRAGLDIAARHRSLDELVHDLSTLTHAIGVSTPPISSPALTPGTDDRSVGRRVPPELVAALEDPDRDRSVQIETAGDRPDATGLRSAVGATRGSVLIRREEVTELRGHLSSAERANRAVDEASSAALAAAEQVSTLTTDLATADDARSDAANDWSAALEGWTESLRQLVVAAGVDTGPLDEVTAAPLAVLDADGRQVRIERLGSVSDALLDHHRGAVVAIDTELGTLGGSVTELDRELTELAARTHPDPPAAPWQRRGSAWQLADLVDFADHLSDQERTGLESAMEASGLLGAELNDRTGTATATLLVDGQVVTLPAGRVAAPLSDLLVVSLPDPSDERCATLGPPPGAAVVTAVLDAVRGGGGPAVGQRVQDRPADGEPADPHDAPSAAVGTDGSFRMGTLAGRWRKERAEHIGTSARRAALERRRNELTRRRQELRDERDRLALRRERAAADRAAATEHHGAVPSQTALVRAEERCAARGEQLARAEHRHDERVSQLHLAEADAARADETVQRRSTELSLPRVAEQLDQVADQLRHTTDVADQVERAVDELDHSWTRWSDASDQWVRAVATSNDAVDRLGGARRRHDPVAMELASVEDAVGAQYEEVLAAIDATRTRLGELTEAMPVALEEHEGLVQEAATADSEAAHLRDAADGAARSAVAAVAPVAAAIQLPGLWSAATDAEPPLGAPSDPAGAATLGDAVLSAVPRPDRANVTADGVRQTLRNQRDRLGAGWDAEEHQPDERLPWVVEVTGPDVAARAPLAVATRQVHQTLTQQNGLLTAQQDQALQNLLQGLIAKEVAAKMQAADELVRLMQARLSGVTTSHGVGASLRWRRRRDVDPALNAMVDLLCVEHDLRTPDQERALMDALSARIAVARAEDPEAGYRELIAHVLDYRQWFDLDVLVQRPGESPKLLSRRSALSEGEKKIVSYLPLFAAVAASCDALATEAPHAPRFVLLDDAFAKVSEDNHARLFGLLVELDLDFIATSERLWGTHSSVPELAITEVLRDADLGVIALEHFTWNGHERTSG